METLRIGVVGIGNIGSVHAVNIYEKKVRGLVLTAVCDIDASKCERAETIFPGIEVYLQYEKMIAGGKVDAVIIATPHDLHPPIAVCAFRHGLHVLTEKPAGVYTKQVEEMNAAAAQSGKVFGIMFNQRTNPLFQKARELVGSGELGQPKRLVWIVTNWYRTQAYYDSGGWRATWSGEGGGVLMNQAPHNLDLWQWMLGMPARIRAFCGYGKYHRIEVEDEAAIYAEYPGGATATFLTGTGEYPGTNRLEITGDRGKLVIEDGKMKIWLLAESERAFCFRSKEGSVTPKMHYSEYEPEAAETAHIGILQNFTNCILNGEALLAPGYDGINALTLANAAYLSDWTDGWVDLPLDGEAYLDFLEKRKAKSRPPQKPGAPEPAGAEYKKRWDVRW